LDLICLVKRDTTKEEVNKIFKEASKSRELKGILRVEENPLVSNDFKGDPYSAIVDALSTMVKNNLIKVVAWYDNEFAYACRLAEFAEYVGKKL